MLIKHSYTLDTFQEFSPIDIAERLSLGCVFRIDSSGQRYCHYAVRIVETVIAKQLFSAQLLYSYRPRKTVMGFHHLMQP